MNGKIYKNACKVNFEQFEYQVDSVKKTVFEFEPTREKRKQQLKEFIYSRLKERWMTIPKQTSALERKFVNDLIQTL